MGRKRPFKCPVKGCEKRGTRSDLSRHARAIHPGITPETYRKALINGSILRPVSTYRPFAFWSRLAAPVRRASIAFSALPIIGLLLLSTGLLGEISRLMVDMWARLQ